MRGLAYRLRFLPLFALLLIGSLLLDVRHAQPAVAGGGKPGPIAAIHTDLTFTATIIERGRPDTISLRGSADINLSFPDFSMRARFDLPAEVTGQAGALELVIVDNKVFTRGPGQTRWDVEPLFDDDILGEMMAALGTMPARTPSTGDTAELAAMLQVFEQLGIRPERLPNETLAGQPVEHWRLALNAGQIGGLLRGLLETAAAAAGEALTPADLEDLGLDELLESNLRLSFDLWTGVRDGFPYRFAFSMGMTIEGTQLSMALTLDSIPLAQRVAITAPPVR